jgi:lipid A 4'-phosphatase
MASHPASPLSGYFRLPRSRAILGSFLVVSLLLAAFPAIDLRTSRVFYDNGFNMAFQGWTQLLHASVTWFVAGSLGTIATVYAWNRLFRQTFLGVDGRKMAYLVLVLALGAGLVVNSGFKDGFGRARPRDIVEFGGSAQFTPAFAVSSNCSRNCSFSSGDSAGAFFALALAVAARRRRAATAAAVGYGVLVSAARIASGAHFLSDTVVSFFVMLIVSDALHHLMERFNRVPAVAAPALPALL